MNACVTFLSHANPAISELKLAHDEHNFIITNPYILLTNIVLTLWTELRYIHELSLVSARFFSDV
jgi:hypothetical protein